MVFHSGWRVANHIHSEHSLPCEGFAQAVRVCPACQRRRPFCHRLGNAHVFRAAMRLQTVVTWESGIMACKQCHSKTGRRKKLNALQEWLRALQLFHSLDVWSVEANLISYSSAVSSCEGQRRVHVTGHRHPLTKRRCKTLFISFSHLCLAIY